MADKPDDRHQTALLVAVVGLVVAVVGAAAGLAPLQPVRDFACEQGSVLCKRHHDMHFFKITYIQPSSLAQRIDPWMVLLNPFPSLIGRSNTECVDDGELTEFLHTHNGVLNAAIYNVAFGDSKWLFDTTPIDPNKVVSLSPNDALTFRLRSQYAQLVRDVTMHMDVTVADAYREDPEYSVERMVTLPKGSSEKDIFCKLFYRHDGNFEFTFKFRDDVWDADDPIVVPLSIATAASNSSEGDQQVH